MKKIKSKIYNNYPNLYIWLKKHIQKTNFPINIHNFLSKNLNENPLIIEAGAWTVEIHYFLLKIF